MRYVVSEIYKEEKDIAYRFYLADSIKISQHLEGKRLFELYQDIDNAVAGGEKNDEPDAESIIDNFKFKLAKFTYKK